MLEYCSRVIYILCLRRTKTAIRISNRINNQIKAREVRVVSAEGEQLGIMSPERAMEIAQSQGLDLVEIAESAVPPVAKIIDFGKFRYEKEKTLKENKKKQKVVVIKEIKVRPQIDVNDLAIKMRRITEFLSEGKKVKVILLLRGRQRLHADRGIELLERIAADFAQSATIEKNYSAGHTLTLTPGKSNQEKDENK